MRFLFLVGYAAFGVAMLVATRFSRRGLEILSDEDKLRLLGTQHSYGGWSVLAGVPVLGAWFWALERFPEHARPLLLGLLALLVAEAVVLLATAQRSLARMGLPAEYLRLRWRSSLIWLVGLLALIAAIFLPVEFSFP